MSDYQDRVINECIQNFKPQDGISEEMHEVINKIASLYSYALMGNFESLDQSEKNFLKHQFSRMENGCANIGAIIKRIVDSDEKTESSPLDKELTREAKPIKALADYKPIESLKDILEKYTKNVADDINFWIADFDTCMGIANHLYKTRDADDLEFVDIFKFIHTQMEMQKQ